jgi:hypothetical protein
MEMMTVAEMHMVAEMKMHTRKWWWKPDRVTISNAYQFVAAKVEV